MGNKKGKITIQDGGREYIFSIKSYKKLTEEEIKRAELECIAQLPIIQELEKEYLKEELERADKEFNKKSTKGFLGMGKKINFGNKRLTKKQFFEIKKQEVYKKFSNPESTFKPGRRYVNQSQR